MVRTNPPTTESNNQPQRKPGARGPLPGQGGRHPKQLSYKLLDSLCRIQCTEKEIESVLELNWDTINTRILQDHGKTFQEYLQEKAMTGKRSLRRKQFDIAMKGNVTMLIWLGKNYLSQADKHEIGGLNGAPIHSKHTSEILAKMPQEELDLLERVIGCFNTANDSEKSKEATG